MLAPSPVVTLPHAILFWPKLFWDKMHSGSCEIPAAVWHHLSSIKMNVCLPGPGQKKKRGRIGIPVSVSVLDCPFCLFPVLPFCLGVWQIVPRGLSPVQPQSAPFVQCCHSLLPIPSQVPLVPCTYTFGYRCAPMDPIPVWLFLDSKTNPAITVLDYDDNGHKCNDCVFL